MLDVLSLRVAFAVLALTVLALFYLITYRSTRAAYSLWWCLALAGFLSGSACYLLNGTAHQVWANPLGNGLAVFGAGAVWAGAQSLARHQRVRRWPVALPPVAVLAGVLDDSARDVWAGGAVFLACMALLLSLAGAWLLRATRKAHRDKLEAAHVQLLLAMAVAAGGLGVFYTGRLLTFLAVGPDHVAFTRVFGSATTTIVVMLVLTVATFSMSTLAYEQRGAELRRRASHDPLTGVLNRGAFHHHADRVAHRAHTGGDPAAVVLADLDGFKALNDTYGHPRGDTCLQAYAQACREAVRPTDLVCRYGGEEFALLLPGVPPARVREIIDRIDARYRTFQEPFALPAQTASYGVAYAQQGVSLAATIAAADVALYRAKESGRARAVFAPDEAGGRAGVAAS